MQILKALYAIFVREYLLTFRNFNQIFSLFIFFILTTLIFVFAIGPEYEIYNKIGIGIIWTILLLSTNLSINRIFQDDFNDGNLILFLISGISLELIVIIKIFTSWLFFQIPFLIIVLITCVILNINIEKINILIITFIISSLILTNLSCISGSMNLLNDRNYTIGSLIVMILSIPIIIFSVSIINGPSELLRPQLNILIGILMFFLAITPWVSSKCIKVSIEDK